MPNFFYRLQVPKEALEVLREYSADVEARNRMIELVPPGHVIQLRPIKVFFPTVATEEFDLFVFIMRLVKSLEKLAAWNSIGNKQNPEFAQHKTSRHTAWAFP